MSMQQAMRQMSASAERETVGQGEALFDAFSDEANCPRHATGDTGTALLAAALTTQNLRRAFKRVRASGRGSASYTGCPYADYTFTTLMLYVQHYWRR